MVNNIDAVQWALAFYGFRDVDVKVSSLAQPIFHLKADHLHLLLCLALHIALISH